VDTAETATVPASLTPLRSPCPPSHADPYAPYFKDPEKPWAFKGIPVCSTYCDDWFTACADDLTCVEDWADWPTTDGQYTCPAGSSCRTYREVYGNGTGLCNRQWGSNFFSSNNMDSCFSMYFWGNHNPNKYAVFADDTNGAAAASSSLVALAVAAVAVATATIAGNQ
jgi:hypothetical protein